MVEYSQRLVLLGFGFVNRVDSLYGLKMLYELLVIVMATAAVVGDDLPPTCDRRVYCNSELLERVQLAQVFPDSKTFVDMHMVNDENTTLAAFQALLNQTNGDPTRQQIVDFVNQYFSNIPELEEWVPNDYIESPAFLDRITDPELRQYAKEINSIWPTLARKVKPIVFEESERFSLIPLSHGFIIPGGRFKEIYYWDTYWIIEGLMICGMHETAKGIIENLIELLELFGHIPNGARCYYQERSQPPLLSEMIMRYYNGTGDVEFLRKYIGSLEKEMHFWLDKQTITFTKKDRLFTLLRYYSPSDGPRPESFAEDYNDAHNTFTDPNRRAEFYIDIKSAAESGWDFSTRWFISENGTNDGNLTNIHTRYIVPVDLNAIFAAALKNTATIHRILKNPRKAATWGQLADKWMIDLDNALWDEQDGIWYDYDIQNEIPRRYFYTSNLAPLWMHVVDEVLIKARAPSIMKYLTGSHGLDFPGGIPVSLIRSGEQWDFPNAWPPEVSIVINGIYAMQTEESSKLAFRLAQEWVRVCMKGYKQYKQMFEKYDAERPGEYGSGGEYTVQEGFGWSNGVVLEFLDLFGTIMTANDDYEATTEPSAVEEKPAENSANTLDAFKVVPLMIGGNYVKNAGFT